jgi:hypothetical protein
MDAETWLWSGGWGSPVGLAIFMAGLGFFFAGFGHFLACVGRMQHSTEAQDDGRSPDASSKPQALHR